MAIRISLVAEVIAMAFDTVRTNKMRSGLTVLGVVIGITSIVGMTAMIRGFDQSIRDSIGAIGPNTIFIGTELQYRRNVVVLGNTAYKALFEPSGTDPIGKLVRVGSQRYQVVGVFDKRPSPGGFNLGNDDFVVIPHTTFQREFGLRAV